jgi:hypothetical protein
LRRSLSQYLWRRTAKTLANAQVFRASTAEIYPLNSTKTRETNTLYEQGLAEGSALQQSFKGDASEKEDHPLSTRSCDDSSDLGHGDRRYGPMAGPGVGLERRSARAG